MKRLPDVLFKKFCFIFHRGFVEARLLALGNQDQQAHDLADAFEYLPGFLPEWEDANLAVIRATLQEYQGKYQSAFDYVSILDMDDQTFTELLPKW